MTATKAGDTDKVLSLMSDDVVFLIPGRPPMLKSDFAAAATGQSGLGAPQIDGTNKIQGIQVMGDWAFMWTRLEVTVTPPSDAPPIKRAGRTLSILKKDPANGSSP